MNLLVLSSGRIPLWGVVPHGGPFPNGAMSANDSVRIGDGEGSALGTSAGYRPEYPGRQVSNP